MQDFDAKTNYLEQLIGHEEIKSYKEEPNIEIEMKDGLRFIQQTDRADAGFLTWPSLAKERVCRRIEGTRLLLPRTWATIGWLSPHRSQRAIQRSGG